MQYGKSDLQTRDDMIMPSDARDIRRAVRMRGFTLVEFMITLVVMAILVSLAAPSLGQLLASNRVSSKVNDFVGALNVARSEAVKSGTAIKMCKSSDGAACDTSGSDWAVGWIICAVDPVTVACSTTLPVLRVHPALGSGTKAVAVPSGMTSLTFLPIGRPPPTYTGGDIQVCPVETKYASFGRKITLNTQGRPQILNLTC